MKSEPLLIYTGGTIGMIASAQGLHPDVAFPARLRQACNHDALAIDRLNPVIDSASATPEHWQRIADTIRAHQHDYSGFVVLHGTDTLAYCAAAMAMMFAGFDKPIVLTGSQYPLGADGSDAMGNIRGALEAVTDVRSRVSVFFGDRLMPAAHVRKVHAQAHQAFQSVNADDLAYWQDDALQWQIGRMTTSTQSPSAYLLGHWCGFQPKSVAMLWITPDMPTSAFLPVLQDDKVKGVVLVSYGSGNVPERQDIHDAIRQSIEQGTRIINVTQCFQGNVTQQTYAAGAGHLGVICGGAMTPEAAFVQLHIELAQASN